MLKRIMADSTTNKRRNSGIRLRKDLTDAEALGAAQTVIGRLQDEIDRLGDVLEAQRARYERTLAAEREERRQLIEARGDRSRRLADELDLLREANEQLVAERDAAKWSQRRSAAALKTLRAEHERAGQAYRSSLRALRRSFEQQLEVA